ncbi:unnamed protein product [Prunus brigantina]
MTSQAQIGISSLGPVILGLSAFDPEPLSQPDLLPLLFALQSSLFARYQTQLLGKGSWWDLRIDSILENFGKCGLASSFGSFLVKYVNDITRLCIIRASREEYQKVWSAVTMVRSIAGCPVLFNLLDLSGDIKACKKAALKCDELKFEQHKIAVGSNLSAQDTQKMQNYLDKIKGLEH